jgi:ComF family protein
MLQRLLEGTLERLYPPTCVLCGAPGHAGLDLCPGCLADLPHNLHCCARCALPLPTDRPVGSLCGGCLRKPPPFAACLAAFRYEDPLPALVGGAKFRGRLNLARLLGLSLARYVGERSAQPPGAIVPVPLHPDRLRERGYNQALEVARAVARALSIPLDTGCCARVRATAPQASLERKERRRNLRGAFEVHRPPATEHVVILDDVVTTGSTAAELTKALLAAGAHRVEVWAVARTP